MMSSEVKSSGVRSESSTAALIENRLGEIVPQEALVRAELPVRIPKKAICIYVAVAWLFIILVLVVGVCTGAGNAAGWAVAPVSMLFVTIVTFLGCCKSLSADSAATPSGEEQAAANAPPGGRPRMAWMDNAKVVMIMLVVTGHSGLAFSLGGAGISFVSGKTTWFTPGAYTGLLLLKPLVVPLFFFISGFFAPSALDRKGPRGFMKANFRRLGPAYFLFWLALNPLTYYMAYALVSPTEGTYAYFPNSAATWFLNWLLVFQCCYAFIDCTKIRKEIPSFSGFLCWSALVTIMQLAASLALLVGGSTLGIAEGPMIGPGGDGFFCGLTFMTGIVAKRSDWLVNPLPARLVRLSRIGVLAMIMMGPVLCFIVFSPDDNSDYHSGTVGIIFLALQIPSGPYLVCVQVTIIHFFQQQCNFETSLTKFAANCAFTVYLIHYIVVNVFSYTWVVILDNVLEINVTFVNSTTTETEIDAKYLYAGFVYVASLSVVTSFALAGLMKAIPVLRD